MTFIAVLTDADGASDPARLKATPLIDPFASENGSDPIRWDCVPGAFLRAPNVNTQVNTSFALARLGRLRIIKIVD